MYTIMSIHTTPSESNSPNNNDYETAMEESPVLDNLTYNQEGWLIVTDDNIKAFVSAMYWSDGGINDANGYLVGVLPPTTKWDTSQVTDMSHLFYNMSTITFDITGWDVSGVTNMSYMFSNSDFNQKIGSWDVGNVRDMSHMFMYADSFNQDISQWNVSEVNDMSFMFEGTMRFNCPIGGWDVGNVFYMQSMFRNATAFNQAIGGWNVKKVIDMDEMFSSAERFNQPLNNWHVGNPELHGPIATTIHMFRMAHNFNRSLNQWIVYKKKMSPEIEASYRHSQLTPWAPVEMFWGIRGFKPEFMPKTPTPEQQIAQDAEYERMLQLIREIIPPDSDDEDEDNYSNSESDEWEEANYDHGEDVEMTDVTAIERVPLRPSTHRLADKAIGYDPILREEMPVKTFLRQNPDHIVFRLNKSSYVLYTKSNIAEYYTNPQFIKLGCNRIEPMVNGVAPIIPTAGNIDHLTFYLNMTSIGVLTGLIPISEINELIQNPTIRCVEVSAPIHRLDATASQYIAETPVSDIDANGADHCQHGTAVNVHSLLTMNITLSENNEARGGRKKTKKRNKTQRNKTMRRRTKRIN